MSSTSVSEQTDTPEPPDGASTGDGNGLSWAAGVPDHVRIDRYEEWPIPEATVTASVVIVTYGIDESSLGRTLDHLDRQTADDFEIVVVDNGTDWNLRAELARRSRVRAYAELAENYGVTVGRNAGAGIADGDLLLFLDDDAIPAATFVDAHRRLHRESDIVAARGRVLPRNDTIYNRLQSHYDLGPDPCPHVLNIEGNTSFDCETFRSYGGYDAGLDGRAGHEGLDLTYRMVAEGEVRRGQIVYHPEPVVYHDYASDLVEFVSKQSTHSRKAARLDRKHDRLFEFASTYDEADTRTELTGVDYLSLCVLGAMVRIVRLLSPPG